jgi:hypothetical protein
MRKFIIPIMVVAITIALYEQVSAEKMFIMVIAIVVS